MAKEKTFTPEELEKRQRRRRRERAAKRVAGLLLNRQPGVEDLARPGNLGEDDQTLDEQRAKFKDYKF